MNEQPKLDHDVSGKQVSNTPGRFVVHIGLPKTATTTLQMDVFSKLDKEKFIYLGVNQPRNQVTNHPLFDKFYRAVIAGERLAELRKEISVQTALGKTVLISEEMITSSGGGASWRRRLKHLGLILEGMKYEILVTVREPVAAMFSYYCELFPLFPSGQNGFFECALKREEMEIFHYGKLLDVLLESFDRQRIHFLKFEDIIQNNTHELFMVPGLQNTEQSDLIVQNRNFREKSSEYQLTRYWMTPVDLIRRLADRMDIRNHHVMMSLKFRLGGLIGALDRIKLVRIKVRKPSEQVKMKLRDAIRTETACLEIEFGIKYE